MSLWATSEVITTSKINQKEVFIGATAPASPTDGQLWYDTTANRLKYYSVAAAAWKNVVVEPVTPGAHASSHQDLGSDEISVAGLSGLLGDGQKFIQVVTGGPFGQKTTTSSTAVHCGDAVYFTPSKTTRVIVLCMVGSMRNYGGSPGSAANARLRYGTGTAPVTGAAGTGTQVGDYLTVGLHNAPGLSATPITGLLVGTQYWIDMGHYIYQDGTSQLDSRYYTIIEG